MFTIINKYWTSSIPWPTEQLGHGCEGLESELPGPRGGEWWEEEGSGRRARLEVGVSGPEDLEAGRFSANVPEEVDALWVKPFEKTAIRVNMAFQFFFWEEMRHNILYQWHQNMFFFFNYLFRPSVVRHCARRFENILCRDFHNYPIRYFPNWREKYNLPRVSQTINNRTRILSQLSDSKAHLRWLKQQLKFSVLRMTMTIVFIYYEREACKWSRHVESFCLGPES